MLSRRSSELVLQKDQLNSAANDVNKAKAIPPEIQCGVPDPPQHEPVEWLPTSFTGTFQRYRPIRRTAMLPQRDRSEGAGLIDANGVIGRAKNRANTARWSGYGCKPAARVTRSASLLM